jgi:hypothetical protein
MKIGDIDVANSIVNIEYDVNVLQQFVNYLMQNNPSLKLPTQEELNSFQETSVRTLNQKYPNMGIKKDGAS